MHPKSGRIPFLCTLVASLLLLPTLLTATAPPTADEPVQTCEQVQAFVEEHIDEIPRDYDSLIELPIAYRKAVYHRLQPAERLALWTVQWQRVLDRAELTAPQRDLLLEALRLTGADFALLADGDASAREALQGFFYRAEQAFGREGARSLFSQLGPSHARHTGTLSDGNLGVILPASAPIEPRLLACSCNIGINTCEGGVCTDYRPCFTVQPTCGPAWGYPCDGLCQ